MKIIKEGDDGQQRKRFEREGEGERKERYSDRKGFCIILRKEKRKKDRETSRHR